MPRPKLDDTLPPGVYPASGTIGYPYGTGVLDDPYAPGQYPIPEDGVACSNPIGCPVGVGITATPDGPEPTLDWTFHINHTDDVHNVRWDFGDGTSVILPSDQDATHSYDDDGTYTVTATCHGQVGTVDVDAATPATVINGELNFYSCGGGFNQFMLTLAGITLAEAKDGRTFTVDVTDSGNPPCDSPANLTDTGYPSHTDPFVTTGNTPMDLALVTTLIAAGTADIFWDTIFSSWVWRAPS